MAAESLVLVYQRPENLECSLGSALRLQDGPLNPECGHCPGEGESLPRGGSAVLKVFVG